jgi:hypothetical protein
MDGSIRKKWRSTLQVNAAGKWKVESNSFDHGGVGVVWKRGENSMWNFRDGIEGLKMGYKKISSYLWCRLLFFVFLCHFLYFESAENIFLYAILYTVFEIVNYAKLTVKVEIHKVKRNDIILKCRTKRSLNNI